MLLGKKQKKKKKEGPAFCPSGMGPLALSSKLTPEALRWFITLGALTWSREGDWQGAWPCDAQPGGHVVTTRVSMCSPRKRGLYLTCVGVWGSHVLRKLNQLNGALEVDCLEHVLFQPPTNKNKWKKKKNMFFFLKKKLHKILNTILLANQFFFDTAAWFFPTLKCFLGLP